MFADVDRRVLSYGDTVLHESDLQTLKNDTWLNDRILTFAVEYLYDTMLNETEKQKVCIVQAAVCQMFKFVDWKGATSLCESLSLADKEHIIFVMNNHSDPTSPGGSHWSVLFYHSGDLHFSLVDSLPNPSLDAAQQLLKTITKCLGLRSAELIVADAAKQRNGSDCGVYAIEFVRIYLRNLHNPSAVDFTEVSAKEVAIQRDCWLAIIRNLVNEENITHCAV
uniref:Ubiquitin-like protease family profile domain-containing protein n=1 Tax=Parascaris univalens TaxID=6257 RepID=A0A915BFA5_PARUN